MPAAAARQDRARCDHLAVAAPVGTRQARTLLGFPAASRCRLVRQELAARPAAPPAAQARTHGSMALTLPPQLLGPRAVRADPRRSQELAASRRAIPAVWGRPKILVEQPAPWAAYTIPAQAVAAPLGHWAMAPPAARWLRRGAVAAAAAATVEVRRGRLPPAAPVALVEIITVAQGLARHTPMERMVAAAAAPRRGPAPHRVALAALAPNGPARVAAAAVAAVPTTKPVARARAVLAASMAAAAAAALTAARTGPQAETARPASSFLPTPPYRPSPTST